MKLLFTILAIAAVAHFTDLGGFVTAHASETVNGAKKDMEKFKAEMNAKLDAADKEIAALKASAKEKTDAAKEKTIADLQAAREKLRAEIKELKADGTSKWQQMKKGVADSVDRLNKKVQDALKE